MTSRKDGTSRRTFLKGSLVAAAAVGVAPHVITSAKAAEPLIVNTWGGSWTAAEAEAYYKVFTKDTGIEIKTATPVSFAKLKAQVETGNYEWDVSSGNPVELKNADAKGWIEPLDWKIIDKSKLKVPVYANGIGHVALATLLMYRTDKFPNGGPQSWADFWNVEKFPGKRSLYDRSFTALGIGLVADGVPVDKVYPMDIDRSFKSLDKIKKHIRVWWKQGNQSQQLIQDGEVDMMAIWSGRGAESILKAKTPATLVWNGAEKYDTYWFVPKGTPRREAAMRFIEYTNRPDLQAKFCTTLPYGPLNTDAFQYMKEEDAKWLPTYPANAKLSYTPDSDWLAPQIEKVAERWTQWVAS